MDGIKSIDAAVNLKNVVENAIHSNINFMIFANMSEQGFKKGYDSLMNQLATHQTPMELNAMNVWFREGGRLIN